MHKHYLHFRNFLSNKYKYQLLQHWLSGVVNTCNSVQSYVVSINMVNYFKSRFDELHLTNKNFLPIHYSLFLFSLQWPV